jgi:molybdopterin-guanine dinucleotide biosynthesis protein A
MKPPATSPIGGIILAGGQARRMGGGDKALLMLGGESLLTRAIARIRPQIDLLLLSANGDPARFRHFGLPVLADPIGDQWGPLAGILAGLDYLADKRPDITLMASFAADTPFLPTDLVARLLAAREREGAELAMAESDGHAQPVFALWPVALAGDLRRALQGGLRKVEDFARRYPLARAAWPEAAFFNINRPDDLQAAAKRL